MQPINILHIIAKLPVGGVENQLAMVVKRYDRERFQPFVCCLSGEDVVGREIEDSGTQVIYLNKLQHQFRWSIVRDIYNLIKRKDIKIVRTHQYHANFYGRLAAIWAGVPCIVASVHNVYTIDKKIHRRIINKILSRFTDRVVAVSEAVKNDILKYDRVKRDEVGIIYNGVDVNRFLNVNGDLVRREFGIAPDTTVVGTVGRLTMQKGHKCFIDAISKIKGNFPEIAFLLIGDGSLKNDLESYAETLGMKNNIIFAGSRRDIPEVLAAMDIFVFPSLWEGLGTAVLEAMAAGKPIIASDLPPIREMIEHKKNGMLAPVKDSTALAQSIKLLLDDKKFAESLGRSAKEKASSCFSIETTVSNYTALFENVLNGKSIAFD